MSLQLLELGFKAFDLHELFPHLVAQELGFYREVGLSVSLRDTTFLSEETWPENLYSTACGAALCSALKGGRQRIFVGAVRGPMFWLAGTPDCGWEGLRGGRLASFPFLAPPHLFLRILLRERGLDPDHEVLLEPVRDDVARFGLLRSGQVSAALLSSAVLPSTIKREGFEILAYLGDDLMLPTSGLALIQDSPSDRVGWRQPLSEAYQRALAAIRESHSAAVAVQKKWLPGMKEGFGNWMRSHFVTENAYVSEELQRSVDRVAAELGVEPLAAAKLFC